MAKATITHRDTSEKTLIALLGITGVAAVVGGLLLAIRPDGSLLQARLAALAETPFADWRIPGILLATLVGVGGLGATGWLLGRGWHARELVCLYAIGLLGFELVELAWIGFQPLEAVFGVTALAMLALALRSQREATV